ncbi:MAG: carboxymuconolactone decarboxylase family protein [Proteobacteria bacterium]|nr:carboxymuconolactone decarboxylase family protein [Pseudomonadota bacterium]
MLAEYQITLPPQTLDNAGADAKPVLEKALAQVGVIPNMYARMVHLPGLLDTYLHGYAAFRGQSGFSTQEQEIIFLAISRENGCEYCVAAHSFIADKKSGVPPEVTDAMRDGRPIPNAKLQALAEFTRIMVASRGLPSSADAEAFLAAGHEDRHILGIVLAISVKTLSNYTNHLFHTPLDAMFESRRWKNTA